MCVLVCVKNTSHVDLLLISLHGLVIYDAQSVRRVSAAEMLILDMGHFKSRRKQTDNQKKMNVCKIVNFSHKD